MQSSRRPMILALAVGLGLLAVAGSPARAQRIPFEKRFFNEQVLRPHSQPVVPIYEGWCVVTGPPKWPGPLPLG